MESVGINSLEFQDLQQNDIYIIDKYKEGLSTIDNRSEKVQTKIA